MAYPYEKANTYDANSGRDNVEQKGTGAYLNLAGATQLKTGSGFIDQFSGFQGTGSVTFYDVAAGTVASLASLQTIGAFPAQSLSTAATAVNAPQTVTYHAQYNNGLYVNTVSTATVSAGTLSYS